MARPLPLVGLNEGMPPGPAGGGAPGGPARTPNLAAEVFDAGADVLGLINRKREEEETAAKKAWLAGTAADLEIAADRFAGEHEADPEAFATVFEAAAQPYLETAPDDETRALMTEEARRIAARRGVKIDATVMARADQAAAADLLGARDQFDARANAAWRAGDFTVAPDPDNPAAGPSVGGLAADYAARAGAIDEMLLAKGMITGAQLAASRQRRQTKAAENVVLGEFDRVLAAGDLDAAETNIEAFVAAEVADPADRDRLTRRLEARLADARRAREAQADQAEAAGKAHIAAIQRSFLNRLYRPTKDNGGPLSADEILASPLPAFGQGGQSAFIGLLDKSPSDVRHTDPELFNDRFRRIHLPDGHPDKIAGADALLADVGNGLGPEDFGKLESDIKAAAKPGDAALKARKDQFVKAVTDGLDQSSLLGPDAGGPQRVYRFLVAFDKAFAARTAAGADPFDLLDPGHKDYLGAMPEARRPTLAEIQRAQAAELEREAAAYKAEAAKDADGADGADADGGPPPRQPGETADQYLKRTGLE